MNRYTPRLITDINDEDGMFMKLFDYLNGANDRHEWIDMTVPVSTKRQFYTKGKMHKKNSHFKNLTFVKIHNSQISVLKKITFQKSQF